LDTIHQHELNDLSESEPEVFKRMSGLLVDFLASVENSQANETKCGKYGPNATAAAAHPLAPSKNDNVCAWTVCETEEGQ
jgi:hypothetical protein